MADNVTLNAASGTFIPATDERTINSIPNLHVQRVVVEGGTAFATGQVTPTTTAATLVAARETRKSVSFYNRGSVDVFVGPATVTAANGFAIEPGASFTPPPTTALIQCIIAAGTATSYVQYWESYDA